MTGNRIQTNRSGANLRGEGLVSKVAKLNSEVGLSAPLSPPHFKHCAGVVYTDLNNVKVSDVNM